VTFGGQSLLRYGQLRYAGKQRPLRKSVVERFAALTREERRTSHWSNETQGRFHRKVMPPSVGSDAPKNIGGSDAALQEATKPAFR